MGLLYAPYLKGTVDLSILNLWKPTVIYSFSKHFIPLDAHCCQFLVTKYNLLKEGTVPSTAASEIFHVNSYWDKRFFVDFTCYWSIWILRADQIWIFKGWKLLDRQKTKLKVFYYKLIPMKIRMFLDLLQCFRWNYALVYVAHTKCAVTGCISSFRGANTIYFVLLYQGLHYISGQWFIQNCLLTKVATTCCKEELVRYTISILWWNQCSCKYHRERLESFCNRCKQLCINL